MLSDLVSVDMTLNSEQLQYPMANSGGPTRGDRRNVNSNRLFPNLDGMPA
jgi:hypothetical protein